jgi:hypothetical protein
VHCLEVPAQAWIDTRIPLPQKIHWYQNERQANHKRDGKLKSFEDGVSQFATRRVYLQIIISELIVAVVLPLLEAGTPRSLGKLLVVRIPPAH